MSSKGVTPVVATALLIGIAVSSVVTASVFMMESRKQVKNNFLDNLNEEQKEDKSELTIEYGYNQSGFILLDLRNTGSIALPLNKSGRSTLALYEGGRPDDSWRFLSDRAALGVDGRITINTTERFPGIGNYTKIKVTGPFGTDSSIVCYNDGNPSC
ncbi:MAG: archaellin/type IV pilin N-terminal domain-containing protein [Candidatus Nanohalobium sp.]